MFKDFRIITIVFFVIISSKFVAAQELDSARLMLVDEYTSISEALKEPDKVYKLNLHKSKLTKFPKEIFLFKNLQELDLSNNAIASIPDSINKLKNLRKLSLSKNGLTTFPKALCNLKGLKWLILSKNKIPAIPKEIGNLTNLIILDMWSNDLGVFPDELAKLKKLRVLDLRVIALPDWQKEIITELLPNTNIKFSGGCNCMK